MTPAAAKTTEPFKFDLYRNFISAPNYSFSNKLLEGSMSIDVSKFISGEITDGTFVGGL